MHSLVCLVRKMQNGCKFGFQVGTSPIPTENFTGVLTRWQHMKLDCADARPAIEEERTDRAQKTGNGRNNRLINIFKYLSHCFASFPAPSGSSPPPAAGFIEKPFYGFMLESHCQVATPHHLEPSTLVWCIFLDWLCTADPLALFLSHFKRLFVVVPPGSGINSQRIMVVNKLFCRSFLSPIDWLIRANLRLRTNPFQWLAEESKEETQNRCCVQCPGYVITYCDSCPAT